MENDLFDFATANRIIFGKGKLELLSDIIQGLGRHVFVVKGKSFPDPKRLYKILETSGIERTEYIVSTEPNLEMLIEAVSIARQAKCDFVIGFGGGAPIDAGKAIAALLNNKGDILNYLEVVGKGMPLGNPSKPYIAIPTTSGTGSEVTRNAVISILDKQVKVSMRDAYLLPTIALIDPELTVSVPPHITASTGMDAFTQVIEPYLTKNTNPLVDMFCREAIPRAAKSLYKAYENGGDMNARVDMSFVSLLGGLSLANAKLGAVHGFAGPIGGMFHAPHGVICAALLPAVMVVNAESIENAENSEQKMERFKDIARWVTGDSSVSIHDGVGWIAGLAARMKIPGLAKLGISPNDFPTIIEKSRRSSSMKGNPVLLTENQMHRILEMSL